MEHIYTWVDLGLMHPLVLFSMSLAIAFSLLLNMLIFFLLVNKHKVLSTILFTISFFMTIGISILTLRFSYNFFIEKASVGLGGFPFNFIFEFTPPLAGLILSYYLFVRKKKKIRA